MFRKSKKNTAKIFVEILFSLVVAYLLSLVASTVLFFIFASFGASQEYAAYINFAGGVVFGLALGYKLKEIVSRK